MRIAFVYDAVYPEITGGVERRVWEIARRLAARGHEVHLFGMHLWEGDRIIVRERVYLHGICRPYRLYREGKRRFYPSLMFGIKTFFALRKERFNIVDCQQFPYLSVFSAALSCRISGSLLVVTWHEVWDDYWYEYLGISGAAGKWIERVIAKIPANTIAVSETTAEGLARISGGTDISIIPNGISIEEIDAVELSGEKSDIVFVGRLIPEKHVDILIETVSLLINQFPDIRCLIIGDGPERRNLEMKVRTLGVENHVLFTGKLPHSNDVISSLKSSRVFVFPSTREGFGISVLEALACGLPVVTIDHPKNASRVFIRNGCGFLSTLGAADLSDKIQTLLNGKGTDARGCRMVAHQYEWERITDTIDEYYHWVHEKDSVRNITLEEYPG